MAPKGVTWRLGLEPGSRKERRCALVLIVSDYARASGLPGLAGAAHDERRISAMFAANGFSVVQGVAPARTAIIKTLTTFARDARSCDAAVIYSTGHGIECDGTVYLLPGDYPIARGYSRTLLRTRAVSVDQISRACRARTLNLVFFAGCRTLVHSSGFIRRDFASSM